MENLTTEKFVQLANAKHGKGRYDYSDVTYTNSTVKVSIRCRQHGLFTMLPAIHSRTGKGCPQCGEIKRKRTRAIKKSAFIARSRLAHGSRYDYATVPERPSATAKVPVLCYVHGEFKTALRDHARGSGCPGCMQSGFRKLLPGHVYVLKCDDLTKVGVTNRLPAERAKELRKRSGKRFELVTSKHFKSGADALATEMRLLSYLRSNYTPTGDSYEGSTETFVNVDRENLLSLLNEQ